MLTGKPVGLTFEDIDAYAKQPGFAIDPQPLRESAAPLDTPDDFRVFFEQLAAGDDPLRAKRMQLTKLPTNTQTDTPPSASPRFWQSASGKGSTHETCHHLRHL